MTDRLFTKASPATSIIELLEHLKSDRSEQYLFRGQTRDYGCLIPSIYRRAAQPEARKKAFIPVDPDRFWRTITARQRQRFSLMDYYIHDMGKLVGNVLSQQYGFSSECIDVTGDPRIAAFFATRTYPSYAHFPGSPDDELGIIYRILRSAQYFLHLDGTLSLEDIEHRMGWVGGFYGGKPVWFQTYFKLSELDPRNPRDDPRGYFERIGGGAPARLNTRVAILAYRDIAPRIAALFKNGRLHHTRIMRQDGGLIQAPTASDGTIPQQAEIDTDKRTGELLVYPSVAVANRIVGIYDIAAYNDVEAFYFRHSGNEITAFTPDYLWPSVKVDYLYRHIAQTAKQHAKEYLSQHACDVADPGHGVLDPGYVVADAPRRVEDFVSRVRRWFVSAGRG